MNNTPNLWLMEETFLKNYLETIGGVSVEGLSSEDIQAITTDKDKHKKGILSINGDTAEVEIFGVLSRNGPSWIDLLFGFNGTAYNDIISSMQEIKNNPDIKNIVLRMNTPGGNTAGLDEAWQAIYETAKSKKIIALNEGTIASAGYYLASAAHKILATAPSNWTGAIGTVVRTFDYSRNLEERGIKQVVITSKNAPKKQVDLSSKEGVATVQRMVDALERIFYSRISEGRKISNKYIAENFGQGDIFIAKDPDKEEPDALSVKMIDGIISAKDFDKIFSDESFPKDFNIVDQPWNADTAIKNIREATNSKEKPLSSYKNYFFWYNIKKPEDFESYKLPFVDVVNGEQVAIESGILAADNALNSGNSEKVLGIPAEDRQFVQARINNYKARIKTQPSKEKNVMANLKELMDTDPAIAAEVAARDAEMKKSGEQSATAVFTNRVVKVTPFLQKDSKYPAAVAEHALKVLAGESGDDTLAVIVASCDAVKEAFESAAAKDKTDKLLETPAANKTLAGDDGKGDITDDKTATEAAAKAKAQL